MAYIWTIFGRKNILDVFWTAFWLSIGVLIGQDLKMPESYTTSTLACDTVTEWTLGYVVIQTVA